jgi:hypothetical protein
MPLLHRWLGNPLFSLLARWWFKAPIHDVYCGLRAFRKDLVTRLDLKFTGMEFASEMIIKASLQRVSMAEVPITLHPDGRKAHAPHLKTFRDGWRTLRLFLVFSPRWLFLVPGAGAVLLGLLGYAIALPGMRWFGVTFDVHTLLVASLAILCGHQAIHFAVFAKTFAINEGLLPEDPHMSAFFRVATLERGIAVGVAALVAGLALLVVAVNHWRLQEFGPLHYPTTMRWVIPGATLIALGVQTLFGSFFTSVLSLRRR